MRRRVAILLLLVGCSREAAVSFEGAAPRGAIYADTRRVVLDPPSLRPPKSVPCGFCASTGKCPPCAEFGPACRYCGGSGRLEPFGTCFNCRGTGACAACGGSRACDACRGTGTLTLPWNPSPPPASAPRAGARPGPRPDRFVVWLGETVTWTAPKADWKAQIADSGALRPAGEGRADDLRFRPAEPGSYAVTAGGASLYFEVVELVVPGERRAGPGAPLEAAVEARPPLRDAVVRWERIQAGAPALVLEGAKVSAPAAGTGRTELAPTVEIPGLPGRLGPRAAVFDVVDFALAAVRGPVRAGVPLTFEVAAQPPLPKGSAYEWTLDGAAVQTTTVPRARIALPRAGAHALRVRNGELVSAPLRVEAFGLSVRGADGREAAEARLDGQFRVTVEDPAAGAPKTVAVSTRRRDGTELDAPVTFDIGARFMLVGDKTDAAPGDPALLAAPGGTVEISYRGAPALSLPVGPVLLHAIGVRFSLVRGPKDSWPAEAEMGRALDARLRAANEVWERFGLRFVRESLEVAEAPRNLALVTGRAAGVDERGRPGYAGFAADGREIHVPTAWEPAMTPAATARELARGLGAGWKLEAFERLFPSSPDTVILRLAREDGARAALGRLPTAGDASQAVAPLEADLSDGCEVAASGLSVDELVLLLGARRTREKGLDVVGVGGLRLGAERPAFKVHPEGPFAGSALVSWALLDGSGRHPYALARVLGELLLPPSFRPSPASTLFAEPLFGAGKRVEEAAAAAAFARGVHLATGP